VGRNGEGFEGGKEFSCLLGEDPGRTREEADAHVGFPNANVEETPRGASCICKIAGCGRQWRLWLSEGSPRGEAHRKGLQGGSGKVWRGTKRVRGAKAEGCIWASDERVNTAAWLGKPNELSKKTACLLFGEGASGQGEPLQDNPSIVGR
jgi:hypothetical protein